MQIIYIQVVFVIFIIGVCKYEIANFQESNTIRIIQK